MRREHTAILIADVEGEPVGLRNCLSNADQLLADAAPLPRRPRLAWLLKTRRFSQARWAVLAVLPPHRRRGSTVLLIYEDLL